MLPGGKKKYDNTERTGIESRTLSVSSTGSFPEGLVPQDTVCKKMVFITILGSIWKLAY